MTDRPLDLDAEPGQWLVKDQPGLDSELQPAWTAKETIAELKQRSKHANDNQIKEVAWD